MRVLRREAGLKEKNMTSREVQTQVSIHPDHQMSEGDAAKSIERASAKSEGLPPLVQPRGEHFVHVVQEIDAKANKIVESIAKRPDMAASPSPFRISSNESIEAQRNVNENTPLRSGPGPLQMDSPGLSPIVHHQKKSTTDSSAKVGSGGEIEGVGIAYRRTPLKDVGNTQGNVQPYSQQQYTFTPEKMDEDCDEKLLSMQMMDDTACTPAKEARRRDSMDSLSLETMSMLADQSVRTPMRDQTDTSRLGDGDSPHIMSLLEVREQRGDASANKRAVLPSHPASTGKMAIFGVDFDHRGTPVIVPLKGEVGVEGAEGRGAFISPRSPVLSAVQERTSGKTRVLAEAREGRELFFDSSRPASLSTPTYTPTFVNEKGGGSQGFEVLGQPLGPLTSSFWKDRLGRRSMSSVLSSPLLKTAI